MESQAEPRPKFSMQGRRVLVLDAAYQPIQIVNWQRAFVMLAAGKAKYLDGEKKRAPEVVTYSRDGAVIGAKHDIRIPSIIQLGEMVPYWKTRVRFCRKNVIIGRDRCVCQYCTIQFPTEDLTIDHVIPRGQGGQTRWENVVCACFACNQKKANRTPVQASMELMRKPRKPSSVIDVSIKMNLREIPPEWNDYWSTELES